MFFDSWSSIAHVVVATIATFLIVVVLLRLAGAQVQAKMSSYDGIVAVTMGSIMASVALARGKSVADAFAALGTLVLLQELTRYLQSHFMVAHHLVREPPAVFLWNGQLLEDRLMAKNISADEIRAAVRKAGCSSFDQVQIVVLENDGEWSVVRKDHIEKSDDGSAFFGLPIPGMPNNSPKPDGDKAIVAHPYRLP